MVYYLKILPDRFAHVAGVDYYIGKTCTVNQEIYANVGRKDEAKSYKTPQSAEKIKRRLNETVWNYSFVVVDEDDKPLHLLENVATKQEEQKL